jgi:hypothetical protein
MLLRQRKRGLGRLIEALIARGEGLGVEERGSTKRMGVVEREIDVIFLFHQSHSLVRSAPGKRCSFPLKSMPSQALSLQAIAMFLLVNIFLTFELRKQLRGYFRLLY